MQTGTTKFKNVAIEAIVYPACQCGKPYAEHGECGGYKPSRPIENYGTVFFRSQDRVANAIFWVEQQFQKLRLARLRSL